MLTFAAIKREDSQTMPESGTTATDRSDSTAIEPAWPDAIYDVLRAAGIRQVAYVPDAGHTRLIDLCRADPAMIATVLTTEEEGIGLLAGAWLGGERGVLLMQSSGVGNCINMLSLATSCAFPLPMIVTMRGEWAEFNPWQIAMGQTRRADPDARRDARPPGRECRGRGAGCGLRDQARHQRAAADRRAAGAAHDRLQGLQGLRR